MTPNELIMLTFLTGASQIGTAEAAMVMPQPLLHTPMLSGPSTDIQRHFSEGYGSTVPKSLELGALAGGLNSGTMVWDFHQPQFLPRGNISDFAGSVVPSDPPAWASNDRVAQYVVPVNDTLKALMERLNVGEWY